MNQQPTPDEQAATEAEQEQAPERQQEEEEKSGPGFGSDDGRTDEGAEG
jgi:hypothetical protein